MNTLHPQFVVDENRTAQAVLLPVKEWDRIVEDLEELEDIRAYDQAKAGPQEAIPLESAVMDFQRQERSHERSGE